MSMEICEFTISDLTVGQSDEINVSVSVDDIDQFAKLSGDCSPVHIDSLFAKASGFTDRIAHGMLIGAYISRFIGTRLPGRYGVIQNMEMDFRKPLVPPDDIHIKGEVVKISQSVKQVVIKVTVSSSEGSLLSTAKVRSIIRGKS